LEIMICQMLRKVVITDGGDTGLSIGTQISKTRITEINSEVLMNGGRAARFTPTLLGISKSSVETDSWLSAASFQETTKVLTDAAVKGKIDTLRGLKENVIIGKKIPAGTGIDSDRESTVDIKARAKHMRELKALRLETEANEEALRMQEAIGLAEEAEEDLPAAPQGADAETINEMMS
ncbi:MAG: DNA-directed RNA polymerase subunit beta', partial [Erysipelotrichaceae bacterium]|nr:DNA-directed RNA polymerase subunit beta' [Erysipelotrichaceae bacterium]